ncbi:hypothetical protein F4604DRAFT_1894606 [Suillus subluteus]|nr:hypothetical protein F4604DRAFT_1894606 [Suillus subluteus]
MLTASGLWQVACRISKHSSDLARAQLCCQISKHSSQAKLLERTIGVTDRAQMPMVSCL